MLAREISWSTTEDLKSLSIVTARHGIYGSERMPTVIIVQKTQSHSAFA